LFYTVELGLNLYAHFFFEFWRKTKWNWFDFGVIVGSWIPNQDLAAIRLLRTLRFVRISGRFKSFAFLMETLHLSMNGIGSLLLLLFGIVSIFAILGVELFMESSEHFDDFFRALWTLFITLNGESWPEIAEPLIEQFWYTKLYFGTYIIGISVVVMNMIIAVFIEKTAEVIKKRKEKALSIVQEKDHEPLIENGESSCLAVDQSLDKEHRLNRIAVQRCVFILLDWKIKKLMSLQECWNGIDRILSVKGFQILSEPILERKFEQVKMLLRAL